jgi:2'-5' RNA ligase
MNGDLLGRRVFIGIKAPGDIAATLASLREYFPDVPGRFVPPEDIHLTLVPPWQMEDQGMIEAKMHAALRGMEPFTIMLKLLSYGPSPDRPRLAWVSCEPSAELSRMKRSLAAAFPVQDHVPFVPHLTIARFDERDRALLRRRPVEQRIDLPMPVSSVELFLSPHRGGRGYEVLASLPLPLE